MVRYIKASSDGGVTTNLAEFGNRELAEVRDLLTAMIDEGLPEDFDRDGTVPAFNKSSGSVFLTNSEYQVCMIILEAWNHGILHHTPDTKDFWTIWLKCIKMIQNLGMKMTSNIFENSEQVFNYTM